MLDKSRILVLSPKKYSITDELIAVMENISSNVTHYDIRDYILKRDIKINTQIFRLPNKYRLPWEQYFFNKINTQLKDIIIKEDPELVLIYNNEFFLPETIEFIKKRKIKVIFFLGDNPYYTPSNKYNLYILKYADLILCPDSFWKQQLNSIGINTVKSFYLGLTEEYKILSTEELLSYQNIRDTDLLYVGMSYPNTWGLKKAMFMDSFSEYDFTIYGNSHWKKWFKLYPQLENKFVQSDFIPTKRLNAMLNKTKIVPIDGNPGLLNGFHVRLTEVLSAGVFPLHEYRYDINNIFLKESDVKLPLIDGKKKPSEIVRYYLKNEDERKEIIQMIRLFIQQQYTANKNANRIQSFLNER